MPVNTGYERDQFSDTPGVLTARLHHELVGQDHGIATGRTDANSHIWIN